MTAQRPGAFPTISIALAGGIGLGSFGCAVQTDGPLVSPALPALAAEAPRSERSGDPSLGDGFDRAEAIRPAIAIAIALALAEERGVVNRVDRADATTATARSRELAQPLYKRQVAQRTRARRMH